MLSFGWLEDGRCGFTQEDIARTDTEVVYSAIKKSLLTETSPRPVASLKGPVMKSKKPPGLSTTTLITTGNRKALQKEPKLCEFVGKRVSAGSRHSLFLMINCRSEKVDVDRLGIIF